MQRAVASGLARPAALAAMGAGASTSTAHCRAQDPLPNTRSLNVEEGHEDDWSLVCPGEKEVSTAEVREALTELCSLSAAPYTRPHLRARSEGDVSDISDGSSADALIAGGDSGAEAVDELSMVVYNLLNDSTVGPAVMNALQKDPGFNNMVERYAPRHQNYDGNYLPAPTGGLLALPAPYSPAGQRAHRHLPGHGENPFEALFSVMAGIIGKVGEAVCALGNAMRRLPEDINTVMTALQEQRAENRAAASIVDNNYRSRSWEAALMRVVTAVAVAVLARRIIIARMA